MRAGRDRLRHCVLVGAPLAWLGVILSARAGVPAPGRWLEPFAELLASLVQLAMAWTGIDTLRHGAFLYAPGAFAYEIGIGCTGLLPAAVVATAILASPGTAVSKGWGLAVGVPLVLLVNLLRLAHLFYLGTHSPALYEQAHLVWWEGALVGMAFAVWLVWSRVGEISRSSRPSR
ncbi:MAG TPA: hypothetical protein VFU41_02165 [Gemmatimonadales bacterium]|nr:hypothetical protein [Gemmatimonadales bacterium]